MKRKEAFEILGISNEDATEDEIKKVYKDLAKSYHPDINKDPGASDKFKRINEAYTRIQNDDFEQDRVGFGATHSAWGAPGFINIEDIINIHNNGAQSRGANNLPPIHLSINIDFKQSIFGDKQKVIFNRKIKCQACDGSGNKMLDNGCKNCGGKGRVISRNGNFVMNATCNKCFGKVKSEKCTECNGEACLDSETSLLINIPPGIEDGNVLRLSGMGHFIYSNSFGDRYADAYAHVHVDKNNNFELCGEDLVYRLPISLLDAINGGKKTVETLDGPAEIEVPKLSKNKDEIIIPNMGVNRTGNQVIILNVEYPKNIDNLINILEGQENVNNAM